MERLRHLEALAVPRRADRVEPIDVAPEPVDVAPETVDPDPSLDDTSLNGASLNGTAESAADPGTGSAHAEAAPAEPLPAAPPRPRRGALIWAGALTAAVLVGAALSYVAVGLTPGSVGVLQVDPDGEWPETFSPRESDAEIFEEFHGLLVVLVPQDWGGGAQTPCLYILSGASQNLIGGAGCGAGDFGPIAAITVTEQMDDSLTERFAVGSALQFQLRDGEVVIYADGP